MNTDATPQKRRSWKRKILYAILAMVGLAAVLLLAVELYGRWQWRNALAEAREVDPVVTLDEILESCKKNQKDKQKGVKLFHKLDQQLDGVYQLREMHEEYNTLYSVGMGNLPPLGHRLSESHIDAFNKLVKNIHPAMKNINRLKKYEGGYLFADETHSPFDTLQITYSNLLRLMIRIKSEEAIYLATMGKKDEAAEVIDVMFRLSSLVEDSPFFGDQLTGWGMDALTIKILQDALGLLTFEENTLNSFQQRIRHIDLQDRLYNAYRGKRALCVDFEQFIRFHKRTKPGVRQYLNYFSLPGIHGWILIDISTTTEYHNRILRILKAGTIDYQKVEQIDQETRGLVIYPYTHLTFSYAQSVISFINKSNSIARSTRTALAAERYRLDKGEFPVTLDELVPEYMEEIPKDPFDGKPLRYKKKDDRVIFYSIGEDRSDDGGDVEDKTYPVPEDFKPTDWGFVLLKPEYRNQPPVETRPASRPATRSRPAE